MCGVAGHVAPPERMPLEGAVRRACHALAHRGPDGDGCVRIGLACFGHRRLGVIDLAGSPQPWISDDGRWMLTFNGEIYNYVELRTELAAMGHAFRSQGDTEVLLAAYRAWGPDCLERLNGMFAFAVWDAARGELFAARDRLGKKPLYYARLADRDGGGLAFASELGALRAFPGLDASLDPQALGDYLAYQCIPFERTIFRGARKLPPAHYLRWNRAGLRIERWWSPPHPECTAPPDAELAARLRELVEDATRLRLRADVPLGAFLSGGLDSSIVVGTAVRQHHALETYTIGFDDVSHDERSAAASSASFFGTRHHEAEFHIDPGVLLDRVVQRFGEPFADASALPAWHLFGSARRSVTVALAGDGGDELFGGYRRYLAGRWVTSYLAWPAALRRTLESCVMRIPEPTTYFGRSRFKQLRLFLEFARRQRPPVRDCLPQTFSLPERTALLRPEVQTSENDVVQRFELHGLPLVEQMMLADLQAYLAEDVLAKVDRMSMDHALEVRAPLLDFRIVEFACRLPLHLKIRGGKQKWLLREAFRDRLPPHVLRGAKQGFAVPLGRLFQTQLAHAFSDEVLHGVLDPLLRREELERIWLEHRHGHRDHGQKLWTLLVLARWLNSQAGEPSNNPQRHGTCPTIQ